MPPRLSNRLTCLLCSQYLPNKFPVLADDDDNDDEYYDDYDVSGDGGDYDDDDVEDDDDDHDANHCDCYSTGKVLICVGLALAQEGRAGLATKKRCYARVFVLLVFLYITGLIKGGNETAGWFFILCKDLQHRFCDDIYVPAEENIGLRIGYEVEFSLKVVANDGPLDRPNTQLRKT